MEELQITEGEAKALAEGMERVAQHYPVSIDPKTVDWINLGSVIAGVYGPRILAVKINNKRKAQERAAQEPNVLRHPAFQTP